jgi:hypothetical protein
MTLKMNMFRSARSVILHSNGTAGSKHELPRNISTQLHYREPHVNCLNANLRYTNFCNGQLLQSMNLVRSVIIPQLYRGTDIRSVEQKLC